MTEQIDDLPVWARPLAKGPIKVDEKTSDDDLVNALGERLEALLCLYHCDATPEGWRSLALQLATEREDMKVQSPTDRMPQAGGAEPGSFYWTAQRLRKDARLLGSAKLAAEAEKKRNPSGPSVKRLQNLIAEARAGKLAKPRWIARGTWESRVRKALHQAARLLEDYRSQN